MPRGDASPRTRGPGRARSARVTGAPSTSPMGATMLSSMWATMCAENSTCE